MSITYKKPNKTSIKKPKANLSEKVILIDFETKSEADLPYVGSGAYSEHPSTEVIVLGFKFLNEKKIYFWTPGKKLPDVFKNHKGPIVCQNYKFEYHINLNVMPRLPKHWYDLKNYRCTQSTVLRCGLPGQLELLSKALNVKVPKLKDIGNELINKFSKPKKNKKTGEFYFTKISPEDFERFCIYNRSDLLSMEEIYLVLPKLHLDEFEAPIFELDKIMSFKGVLIDIKNTKKLIKAYESYQEKAYKKAEKLCGLTKAGGLVVNSPTFKDWINDRLLKKNFIEDVQKLTLDQLFNLLKVPEKINKKHSEIIQSIQLRKILSGTAEKKLYRMRDMVRTNKGLENTIPDITQYYGSHTGRDAGRGFQPLNFFRGSSTQFLEDVNSLAKGEPKLFDVPLMIKKLMRQLLIPGKGNRFLIGDFKSIEAKVTFWVAGCIKGLKVFNDGLDLYIDLASNIYKVLYSSITDNQRAIGKQGILQLGFGGGHVKLMDTCLQYSIIISKKFALQVTNTYRSTYKEVQNMWYKIGDCFKMAIKSKGRLVKYKSTFCEITFLYTGNSMKVTLPSGRIMYYFKPGIGIDGSLNYVGIEKGQLTKIYTWGGKISQNIIQGIARDIMIEAKTKCSQSPLMFPVFTVYDEIINVCKTKDSKKALKEFERVMCDTPDWAKGLPSGAECVISDRYRKI